MVVGTVKLLTQKSSDFRVELDYKSRVILV